MGTCLYSANWLPESTAPFWDWLKHRQQAFRKRSANQRADCELVKERRGFPNLGGLLSLRHLVEGRLQCFPRLARWFLAVLPMQTDPACRGSQLERSRLLTPCHFQRAP
jgi:hypothetical protein